MKNSKLLVLSVCSIFLFSCSMENKDSKKLFNQFIKEIEIGQLGSAHVKHNIKKISEGLFKVNVGVELSEDIEQKGWAVKVHPNFKGTFHWAPHLTPTEQHIISDHVFRAPALIHSSSEKLITIIPDLNVRAESDYRWYMDLDAEQNCLIIGISDYFVDDHVLFKKSDLTTFREGKMELSFYIMLDKDKDAVENPWRRPLAFMWKKYGEILADKGEPLNAPIKPYIDHTYNWAFNTWKDAVWQEFKLNGKKVGAPAFIVNITQSPNYPDLVDEREMRSIWNQGWFNSLRSAQGLFRYGRKIQNEDLIEKAKMTKELALSFPQNEGFFPAVIATEMEQVEIAGRKYNRSKGWDTYYFGNSNRNPYSDELKDSPLHILDMSCTSTFMLSWYEELERDERLLHYAINYADNLLKLQDTQGFFPGWLDNKTLKPLPILAKSPETAKSITFLLKLFNLTGENRYKNAALNAMKALNDKIIPEGRWEDFETYWSCSRWGSKEYVGKKIKRNNMFKQNSLSIYWTAEALLSCYEITKEEKYLLLGQRTLDELLMNQAVWQPPYMYVNVFGGFGVMNADGEWNDSRQALFSELIIKYGKILNNEEYIQRGIASLKASFSMMYCAENLKAKKQWEAVYPYFDEKDYGFMMENYGHGGYANKVGGGIGSFTIYDWGNGAASEAYNRIVDHDGEEFFNVK
ncbi:hypothetical protein SAMN04487906_1909 [Zhouia amylolytica]|uniref:Uncharacterized protein n=1 Tax=Zhouia amylolytica TaxID=376730 RepID=A0A1I6T8G0_9FLAO|nr:hypothetical protein [Zhouia amylolytica]SFS85423.1 hypothetical protein SAMN04487906_1909 [Zhouia amylolytica]